MVPLARLNARLPSMVRRTWSWSPEPVKVWTSAKYAPSGEKAR